jgi:hypothetical protein
LKSLKLPVRSKAIGVGKTALETFLMQKVIQITVSRDGTLTVETKGYAGADCRAASRFLEQAVGQRTAEQLTSEYHQGQSTEETLRQSQ